MKNYTITVNGNVYDVTVEEGAAGAATAHQRQQHQKLQLRKQHQRQQDRVLLR